MRFGQILMYLLTKVSAVFFGSVLMTLMSTNFRINFSQINFLSQLILSMSRITNTCFVDPIVKSNHYFFLSSRRYSFIKIVGDHIIV